MIDENSIIEDAINQAVESLLPHGAGPVSAVRLIHQLNRVAQIAFSEGQHSMLDEIMTASEVEQEFGLQQGTVRQFLNRNPEAGRKSAGTWLVSRQTAQGIWGDKKCLEPC